MNRKGIIIMFLLIIFCRKGVAVAQDRPFIGVTFFYWYTWDYKREWGGWIDGGVYNTPLYGYYNSPSYEDNYRSLWTASEWGVTHHFMDFWGQGWKAKDNKTPRETVVMKAAEDLQKEGYDIYMSFYQDGEKFNMKDFSRNISDPGNPDVRFWLDNYAKSPAWPKWQGRPFWLVYGRNGSPAQTAENSGFREYLKAKYKDNINELNKLWGTEYSSFDEISLNFGKGWNRVESINYQYSIWQKQMEEMNGLVKEKYGWAGIIPSFDIWVEPYMGYGYSNYHRTFGGPHSYGGIFGVPETQDAQRLIQSAIARYYNTIFWDTYKNYYCDWNTESRIPGLRYAPEPYHFDRFWVGNLMRGSEAMLHLSWNEWWEGSNLEPCLEYGKKFCEKNLFYATIMKECFESIHNCARDAKVAVLLNDWSWLWGGNNPADVYGVIQTLRLFGIVFDLIPDDFVDAKKLENFNLVIAPSNGTGFGFNKDGKPIAKLLQEWVEQKPERRLIVSSSPEFIKYLGLSEGKNVVKGAQKKSLDFLKEEKGKNIAWTILGEQDKSNNLSVAPSGEGEIKPIKKAGRTGKTVGENPFSKSSKYMYFDVDNNFIYNGNWPSVKLSVEYLDEGEGQITLAYDSSDQEFRVYPGYPPGTWKPGNEKIILENSGEWKTMTFYIEDARFANNCNGQDFRLEIPGGLEFVVSKLTLEKVGEPEGLVFHNAEIFGEEDGRVVSLSVPKHESHNPGKGKPITYYNSDLTARDIVFSKGRGEVLFINDLAGSLEYRPYWEKILSNWAKIDLPKTVYGENIRGARLYSGGTNILLAYNYNQTKRASVACWLPAGDQPVAEVLALRSDGSEYKPLNYKIVGNKVQFQDEIQYFGVYEVVFSPVSISHQLLVLHPGEKKSVELTLKNLSDFQISGTIRLKSVIPTLGSEVLNYSLGPKEERKASIIIWAKDTVDWGRKTAMWELTYSTSLRAVYWRALLVERNPEPVITTKVLDWQNPVLGIKNQEYMAPTPKEKGFITNGTAKDVVVAIDGRTTLFGDIASNQEVLKSLNPGPLSPSSPSIERKVIKISYLQNGQPATIEDTVVLMLYPKPGKSEKEIQFYVCNATQKEKVNQLFMVDLPKGLSLPFKLMSDKGESITAQIVDNKLLFICPSILPETCILFTLRKGEQGNDATDLVLTSSDLGTGRGVVKVSNRYYSIALSEEKGGTVINLTSEKGNDYGNNSFGLNYGQFSQHDDLKPAQSATDFINEKKIRQQDRPGIIRVLVDGPVYKKVEVSWADQNIDAKQIYEFYAGQKQFRITVDITPKNEALSVEEIVALDACFIRNKLYKIYPGGSGMGQTTNNFKKEVPHAGFRYTDFVHPYSTLVGRGENISLIIEEKSGLNKYRQGFWPEDRPKQGKIKFAEVEYISGLEGEKVRNPVHLSVWVMFHTGSHKQAKEFQQELVSPLCIVSNTN